MIAYGMMHTILQVEQPGRELMRSPARDCFTEIIVLFEIAPTAGSREVPYPHTIHFHREIRGMGAADEDAEQALTVCRITDGTDEVPVEIQLEIASIRPDADPVRLVGSGFFFSDTATTENCIKAVPVECAQ